MTDKNESDFVGDNFERYSKNAPRIDIGGEFDKRSDKDKIEYLIKLASSLNHAAQLIQKERNELNDLLFSKEAQLTAAYEKITAGQMMIHKQLVRVNEEKQKLLDENQALYNEIMQLEKELAKEE